VSGHLLHLTISFGRPVYRVECIDPAICDMPTYYEDPQRAATQALAQLMASADGRKAWAEAKTDRERDDLLRDEWSGSGMSDQPWPWVLSEPRECWGEHCNDFYDECETFAEFEWPGEVTGPIPVKVTNGGCIDEFMPEVEPVVEAVAT
jgi:hypothetical protein